MTSAARTSPALIKEIRALLPTYLAALVAVVVGSVSTSSVSLGFALIASGLLGFAFGSVALGAQSFGHEYRHHTLGLLLSQPITRRRLFFNKVIVLSAMLVTLTAVTLLRFQEILQRAPSPQTDPSMLMVAAACGLLVAPWLTMLCRSTLAGIVFTIAIPGLLATAADVAGGLIYGLQNAAAIDHFKVVVFWRGMFLICVLSGVAGWRMFTRLEVIDARGEHVHLPDSWRLSRTAMPPSRRSHPVWALVTKELRLQQVTFVVAGLFTLAWLGLAWLDRVQSDSPQMPLISITIMFAGILAMLTGALASAEERHLGTANWQILLPMAAWRQWTVKAGIAWGIVLVLGLGLPALLGFVIPVREWFTPLMAGQLAAAMLLLTTGSLYVSSLCQSGTGALVLSFPSILATLVLVRIVGDTADALLVRRWRTARSFHLGPDGFALALLVLSAGLIGLVLRLAYRNHCSEDRSAVRTWKQVMAIAAYITVGLVVLIGLA